MEQKLIKTTPGEYVGVTSRNKNNLHMFIWISRSYNQR